MTQLEEFLRQLPFGSEFTLKTFPVRSHDGKEEKVAFTLRGEGLQAEDFRSYGHVTVPLKESRRID